MNNKSSILLHNFYHHCDQLPALYNDYLKHDSTVLSQFNLIVYQSAIFCHYLYHHNIR